MPHGTRLYSIAASRYGDTFDGKTTSLCVRRAEYWCPEMNANDPAKKGLCSNFLCDAKPGDEITMTGTHSLPHPGLALSHSCLACKSMSPRQHHLVTVALEELKPLYQCRTSQHAALM